MKRYKDLSPIQKTTLKANLYGFEFLNAYKSLMDYLLFTDDCFNPSLFNKVLPN